jgi:hypothetical protein
MKKLYWLTIIGIWACAGFLSVEVCFLFIVPKVAWLLGYTGAALVLFIIAYYLMKSIWKEFPSTRPA